MAHHVPESPFYMANSSRFDTYMCSSPFGSCLTGYRETSSTKRRSFLGQPLEGRMGLERES